MGGNGGVEGGGFGSRDNGWGWGLVCGLGKVLMGEELDVMEKGCCFLGLNLYYCLVRDETKFGAALSKKMLISFEIQSCSCDHQKRTYHLTPRKNFAADHVRDSNLSYPISPLSPPPRSPIMSHQKSNYSSKSDEVF